MAPVAARSVVVPGGVGGGARNRRHPSGAHSGLGLRGDFSEHLCGGGIQCEYVHSFPLDILGGARALSPYRSGGSYGGVQAVISPAFG